MGNPGPTPPPLSPLKHEGAQYGGHALHDQSDADDARFVACPGKAEGRTEVRREAPPPAPPAQERPERAGPPQGRHTTPIQAGGETGPGRPSPRQAKRSTGPEQDTQRGTDCVERPYRRPVPGPREVRAPHQPREGGGTRTPRERERTHTQTTRGEYQKGNRTEPAECTDRMEWRTSERG